MNTTDIASLSTAMSAAQVSAESHVIIAARALAQTKQEGATALSLIQSTAPSTGDHRGQLVNVMA